MPTRATLREEVGVALRTYLHEWWGAPRPILMQFKLGIDATGYGLAAQNVRELIKLVVKRIEEDRVLTGNASLNVPSRTVAEKYLSKTVSQLAEFITDEIEEDLTAQNVPVTP